MRYFFIMGNLTSIIGLFALIRQYISDNQLELAYWLIAITIILSIIFWIYFYFRPSNPLSKKISSNLDYTGKYISSTGQNIDIVENEVILDCRTWGTVVALPPFEKIPQITIISRNAEGIVKLPELCDITQDSFRTNINSSTLAGKWRWRARGKLLKSTDPKGK